MNKIILRFAAAGALIGIVNNILLFVSSSTGFFGSMTILSYSDRGVLILINAVLTIIFCLIILFPGLVSKKN